MSAGAATSTKLGAAEELMILAPSTAVKHTSFIAIELILIN